MCIIPTELPGKPVGPLEGKDIDRTTITLHWKPPKDDGGTPLTAYVIEKRDAKRMGWTRVDKVKSEVTSHQVVNLTENNEYFFRVSAQNEVGMGKPLESDRPFVPKSPYGKRIMS